MSKDSPTPPDYKGAAEATANASERVNMAQTRANRPDVTTPWGTQTWKNVPTFDEAGYNAELEKYNAANPAARWVEATPGGGSMSGNDGGGDTGYQAGSPGHWEGGGQNTGPAPDRNRFMTDNWSSNISLSPDQQAALDDQLKIQRGRSGAAQDLLGQATDAFSRPFAWGDMPEGGDRMTAAGTPQTRQLQTELNGDSSAYRQRAQDAITKLQQPDLDRRRAAEETRLANQGITKGSEAYESDMRAVSDSESRAHLAAIAEGRNEDTMMFGQDAARAGLNNAAESTMFNQDLEGGKFRTNADVTAGNYNNDLRSRKIAEEAQRRGMTLNELNALLSGQQVQMPQIPGAPTAGRSGSVDYTGAATQGYGAAMDAANVSNAQTASTTSGLASAAAIAAYFAFSDERLKEDIVEAGLLSSGLRVVHYRYRGRPRRYTGVIAQEAERLIPGSTSLHPSGYLMVDYSKVMQ